MKIILIGYMASGKSYLGKKIAKILDFEFLDLDDFIEKEEKTTIKEIFLNKGEIYFRKIEHLYLKKAIAANMNTVISLGGGTPCYSDNMSLLLNKSNIKTVYLQVTIPNLVERAFNETAKRPIIAHLKTKEELTEFVGKHLFERLPFYSKATYTIDANKKENEIIESILMQLF
ncbi:shikimate kinase [Lacinutrix sp. C3R15]|uniref:shikimate kinase n=1 Tax=Flavobacteriaceae TaxID=49546 RepID=UPI001C08F933|nr:MULTISPECIES: shikimate kinase [Flavobacteriaceae]MBU2938396.1 shikimate kinase [Lacinutrix sp. C3R15]MDO6621711.1 shikimate kinase [Oceanihabitans sp. 1_MG-2023]